MTPTLEWNIHYARWMIEDGTPNRILGETFECPAVQFWSEASLATARKTEKSVVPVDDYDYMVTAEVTYAGDSTCIIDFGLKAISYCDLLPAQCRVGEYVTGIVSLHLADYTFVAPDSVFKDLAHEWHVNRISADLTPFIPIPNSQGGWIRDASNVHYSDVGSTDEVQTHSYVLHCSEIRP